MQNISSLRAQTGETRRTKPTPVRLHPARLSLVLALLECSGLDDAPVLVADGLAAVEHLEAADGLCIVVEVLALDFPDVRLG